MATLIKIDKNGSKHWHGMIPCDRCGGSGGSVAWQYTGWTCYKCGGTGKIEATWIERTPEYQAKLDARRAKQQEKAQAEWEARQAEYEANRLEKERIEAEREAQRKAEEEARKAISQYVGEVGNRITVEIVEHFTATFESHIGWKEVFMNIHVMKDVAGNVYKWKTQNSLGFDESSDEYVCWHPIQNDERFFITGTIKEHSEYKGEKQTVLTRCKIAKEDKK